MAVDHALATCLAPDEGVLRLYRWSRPTVSFGRNEPAAGLYDLEAASRGGIDFVRRPTGGRAVLHDWELTYAVVLPATGRISLRAIYSMVNEGLVRALGALGVEASMAGAGEPPLPPDAGPCFQRPAPGEVTVNGRKLVGSAQARVAGAILQHGSLLLGPGHERLAELRGESGEASTPISLHEILDETPSWNVLVESVIEGLSGVLNSRWGRSRLRGAERAEAGALEARYASAEWTWGR